jgi:hypothetical protein
MIEMRENKCRRIRILRGRTDKQAMFKHFLIKNFRCFAELHLDNLERVNLIAGKNNTGKTALLEALRLYCDPSDSLLPTKINEWRGVEDPAKAFADFWAWLFFDRMPTNGAELSSQDNTGPMQTVRIQLTDIGTARSGLPGLPKPPDNFPGQGWHANSPCLLLRYEGPGGKGRVVWVIGPHGEAWYTATEAWRVPCEFINSGSPSADRDVQHFSRLETENRLADLLPSLQILEPRLERLALAVLGEKPIIHGNIGLSRLVPVALMGEGVRRLLSVLLAIVNTPGGVVLIDEVENGLHYSVLKDVWKAIAVAARQTEVQVFATTHSWECIQAAHHAFQENGPYEMRYYRLDRLGGDIVVKSMDQRMLSAVEKTDLEVR